MANRILAIDLTNSAKDFETVAMEQGWPLLDPTNTNCQILRKWLGPLVADPERKGNRVSFYVRNEHGARLDCPVVPSPPAPAHSIAHASTNAPANAHTTTVLTIGCLLCGPCPPLLRGERPLPVTRPPL